MKLNGIAHIVITVNSIEKSLPFYEKIFSFLEFEAVHSNSNGAYFVGGKTAVGIMAADEQYAQEEFNQKRVGLHHFCFRANSRDDVDSFYHFLLRIEAKIIRRAEEGPWAPGYYSVLFEDPDGMRLEVNFVPGKGVLAENTKFNPTGYS